MPRGGLLARRRWRWSSRGCRWYEKRDCRGCEKKLLRLPAGRQGAADCRQWAAGGRQGVVKGPPVAIKESSRALRRSLKCLKSPAHRRRIQPAS